MTLLGRSSGIKKGFPVYFLYFQGFIYCSDRPRKPEKPGKLRELAITSGKSGKTWKTLEILFEANSDFLQILIGVSHAFSSIFDHFVAFVPKEGILITIMKLPLCLNDLSGYSYKEMMV